MARERQRFGGEETNHSGRGIPNAGQRKPEETTAMTRDSSNRTFRQYKNIILYVRDGGGVTLFCIPNRANGQTSLTADPVSFSGLPRGAIMMGPVSVWPTRIAGHCRGA